MADYFIQYIARLSYHNLYIIFKVIGIDRIKLFLLDL